MLCGLVRIFVKAPSSPSLLIRTRVRVKASFPTCAAIDPSLADPMLLVLAAHISPVIFVLNALVNYSKASLILQVPISLMLQVPISLMFSKQWNQFMI